MTIKSRLNSTGTKTIFYQDQGRLPGQRKTLGLYLYNNPSNDHEKQHNKITAKALKNLNKTSPNNFLTYYQDYIKLNRRPNNRHLENSFNQFSLFINKSFIAYSEVTENLCKRFRRFLLDKYTGETPGNYYTRFKAVLAAAASDDLFTKNPTEKVKAKRNPSKSLKNILEAYEYERLTKTPCSNNTIKHAFIFSCYTGLRWVDIKKLKWIDFKNEQTLVTRLTQAKTGEPVEITLHPIAKNIIDKQRLTNKHSKFVFRLPHADKANKELKTWLNEAGINKHITWSCARLSFSVILQDNNVPLADVAYLMGHKSTEHVHKTYKRHRPKCQKEAIATLPGAV